MTPFSALTSKIFAGVCIAALLAFGVQTWRVGNLKGDLETEVTNRQMSELQHKITKSSLEQIQLALEGKNAESQARADAFEESVSEAELAKARNDADYKDTQMGIDELLQRIGEGDRRCLTPDLGN